MQALKQRGERVVYVAGSVREFPESVRTWLSRTCTHAIASSHIYEALAMLTTHRRPAVLIVSIESIDWDELEFFELARRVARDTAVYVAGHPEQQAKLHAAIERGARPFDPEQIAEDLDRTGRGGPRWTTREVLTDLAETACRITGPEDAKVVTEPIRPVSDEPAEASAGLETPAPETPIPFPWSPSPNRPKRTPPQARMHASDGPGKSEDTGMRASGPTPPPHEGQPPGPDPGPVELTPEELAALMGRPRPDDPPTSQEQRS